MTNWKKDKEVNELVESIVDGWAGAEDIAMRAVLGSLITAVESKIREEYHVYEEDGYKH